MKQLIINLEEAYKELLSFYSAKDTHKFVSINKAISDIKKFDMSHRYQRIPKNSKKPRWAITEINIIEIVCDVFGCDMKDIFGESRRTHIVQSRHLCAYILHREQKLTSGSAGELIEQDHASILWSCGAVEKLMKKDVVFFTKKNIVYQQLNELKKEN